MSTMEVKLKEFETGAVVPFGKVYTYKSPEHPQINQQVQTKQTRRPAMYKYYSTTSASDKCMTDLSDGLLPEAYIDNKAKSSSTLSA